MVSATCGRLTRKTCARQCACVQACMYNVRDSNAPRRDAYIIYHRSTDERHCATSCAYLKQCRTSCPVIYGTTRTLY